MLKAQFEKLRDGDYYFYLYDPNLPPLIKYQIKNTKFSDVIKRNTGLTGIAANVFHTEECEEDEVAARSASAQPILADKTGIEKTNLKIYPNPARDVLTVELPNTDQGGMIKIFAASGKLVKTIVTGANEKYLQVNVSDLPSGIYALTIAGGKHYKDNQVCQIVIIKQRPKHFYQIINKSVTRQEWVKFQVLNEAVSKVVNRHCEEGTTDAICFIIN